MRNAPVGLEGHPGRWVVERTFGRPVRYGRPLVDREYLPETSEAMILAAMTHLMIRRRGPVEWFQATL